MFNLFQLNNEAHEDLLPRLCHDIGVEMHVSFCSSSSLFIASPAHPCGWVAASVKFIVTLEGLNSLKGNQGTLSPEESHVWGVKKCARISIPFNLINVV